MNNTGPADVGMLGGQHHRGDAPIVQSDHGSALGPGRLEHGHRVPDLRLQVGETVERNGIGEPGSAPVEVDQSPDGAQPPEEPSEIGELPHGFDVMHPRVDEEKVGLSVADDLERQMQVAVPCVSGLRPVRHATGF